MPNTLTMFELENSTLYRKNLGKNTKINLKLLKENGSFMPSPSSNKQINYGRYKTEMCRQFNENGECKYGDKCQFAHGIIELKDVNRHPKYKTDFCKTFHSKGFCPYGPRCHFIHDLNEKYELINTISTSASQSSNDLKVLKLDEFSDQNLSSNSSLSSPIKQNALAKHHHHTLKSSNSSSPFSSSTSSSSSQSPSPNSYLSNSSYSPQAKSDSSEGFDLSVYNLNGNAPYQTINQLNNLISSLFNININETNSCNLLPKTSNSNSEQIDAKEISAKNNSVVKSFKNR